MRPGWRFPRNNGKPPFSGSTACGTNSSSRWYGGLESLKLGRGGDSQLSGFLDLGPHTLARGRQQLLTRAVEVDRASRTGDGHKQVEKKHPK
jgi:hypothetical protein